MNTDQINKAFKELIDQRGIHNKLGVSSSRIRDLRYNLANDRPVSIDLKLELLKKSGWREEDKSFSRQDLVSLLNFYKRTSQAARDQGPEYVIEKWEKSSRKTTLL